MLTLGYERGSVRGSVPESYKFSPPTPLLTQQLVQSENLVSSLSKGRGRLVMSLNRMERFHLKSRRLCW